MAVIEAPAAEDLERYLLDARREAKFALAAETRQGPLSLDAMRRRREHAARLEGARWGLQALNGEKSELLGFARGRGASAEGMRQLGRMLSKEPEQAAWSIYENLSRSCALCGDSGYVAYGKRCSCFRAKICPAYRCGHCQDSGVLLGEGGALPCACREKKPQRWAASPLLSSALTWQLAQETGRSAERVLSDPDQALGNSNLIWVNGGQRPPEAEKAPSAYAGYGVARLCLDRLRGAGATVRRLTALDLIDEWREGVEWFRQSEVIFVDRPETALPTDTLRVAIEQLLAEAWEWRGVIVVASELQLEATAPSARPRWRDFIARAGSYLDQEGWADLRAGLIGDPTTPLVGEVCSLMLAEPRSDDYLTVRARGLIERMMPAMSPRVAIAA